MRTPVSSCHTAPAMASIATAPPAPPLVGRIGVHWALMGLGRVVTLAPFSVKRSHVNPATT